MDVFVSDRFIELLLHSLIILAGVSLTALVLGVWIEENRTRRAKKKLEKHLLERMKNGEEVEVSSSDQPLFGYSVLVKKGKRFFPRLSCKDGKVYVSSCRKEGYPYEILPAKVYSDLLSEELEKKLRAEAKIEA